MELWQISFEEAYDQEVNLKKYFLEADKPKTNKVKRMSLTETIESIKEANALRKLNRRHLEIPKFKKK